MSLPDPDTFWENLSHCMLSNLDKIAPNRQNVVVNNWTDFKNANKDVVINGQIVYMLPEFFFPFLGEFEPL